MIQVDGIKCTGCGACRNVCPVDAIQMIENEEGFLYPCVDAKKCVHCGKCEKVCPIGKMGALISSDARKYFAANRTDVAERLKSASGGVAALVAQYIISQKGYFCGASFIDGKLQHKIINDIKDFDYMQGSKYFQSEIGTVYRDIKKLLDEGNLVAFLGTPCQTAGLKSYLNKDYEKLYLLELLCHGVPSYAVFKKYLHDNGMDDLINKDTTINFRDKKDGWHDFSIKILNKSKVFCEKFVNNIYAEGFSENLFLRKSCGCCDYCQINRCSDMLLGDFWTIGALDHNLDDDTGLSLISVSPKGEKLLKQIRKFLNLKSATQRQAMQPNLYRPSYEHPNRSLFFNKMKEVDFNNLVNECLNKKKNIAILNFYLDNNNYGAVLTAYALNAYLNRNGWNAYNINYVPRVVGENLNAANFHEFRKKYIPMTYSCKTMEDLSHLNEWFDTFIVGSDQVFRYAAVSSDKEIYYLGFVKDNPKKIAYAASFGVSYFEGDAQARQDVGIMLERFNDISVRESTGVDICRDVFHLKARHVLDPVFLLSQNDWDAVSSQKKPQNGIVYYVLNDTIREKIHKQFPSAQDIRWNVDIEDWISYIKNADVVLTDSFHGICFCIIMHKQFLCVVDENNPVARIESLLEMLGISSDVLLKNPERIDIDLLKKYQFDYHQISKKLEELKKNSSDFLQEALSKENEKVYDPFYFIRQKSMQEVCEKYRKHSQFKIWSYWIRYKLSFGKKRKKLKKKYQNSLKFM